MPVNNPTNSQQALGIADSVQHGNMTLANTGALRTGTTAADTALLQAYDNNTGPAYVTFATLTAGNTPTMDLSDSVTKAGGYIYRAGGTDIPLADGGTNASLVADNGGIFYSTATAAAILPSTSTANQPLLSGASGAPGWSTATYPGSTTINRILYSSANNVIGQITTANNSVVLTDASGVPSLGTSLVNDFTFTSATSGATRTLTVSNSSNTASSAANIVASTAGSTAGDATFQATTTTTTWTLGVDNSVTVPTADTFVIAQGTALGTNNVMSVATSGEINFPLQPAFFATHTVAQDNVTGNGATPTVNFTTEIFDQNNDYDGTNTFTAPVTGRYVFFARANVSSIDATGTSAVSIINTSNRQIYGDAVNAGAARSISATNYIFTCHCIVDMDAADTCTFSLVIFSMVGNTADISADAIGTNFGGYLVC